MDPELEAELEDVMASASASVLANNINRDVDMVMMAEAHSSMAVKSILLSHVMSAGDGYMAGVLCAAIRKTQAMAQLYAQAPEGHRWRIEHEGDEDPGYVRAHTLVNDASEASAGDMPKLLADLEEELNVMSLVDRGKLLVHTITLCDAMLTAAMEVRSVQLQRALGLTEDEGGS